MISGRDLIWTLDYDIVYVGRQTFPLSWSYKAASNDYCRLWYVKQGEVRIGMNGNVYTAKEGEMLLLPYGKGVHISNKGMETLEYISILFELKHDLFVNPFTLCKVPVEVQDVKPIYKQLMEEIVTEYNHKQIGYQMSAKAALHTILVQIARNHLALQPWSTDAIEAESETALKLLPLMEKLTGEPGMNHSSAALAKLLGVSEVHMRRLFKKHIGLSPQKYIAHYRINQSKSLLIDSDLTIQEIAFRLGFSDSNYFSKVFKQQIGRSPSEYRSSTSSERS